MAETSIFWPTTGVGDGASPYTSTQLITWIRRMLGNGVHQGYGGELAISGATSPLSMAYGAAVVNGFPYDAQAPGPYTIAIPPSGSGTTGHSVVLRADWTTQTVRLAVRSSADNNPAFPAVVVNEGVVSEILLAHVSAAVGGALTVIDARDFLYYHTKVNAAMITDLPDKVRTLWVPVMGGQEIVSGNPVDLSNGILSMGATLAVIGAGTFVCPADYVSGMTVKPRFFPSLTGPVRLQQNYEYGAVGEASNHDTNTPAAQTVTTTSTLTFEAAATTLTTVAAGDFVTCFVTRDPTDGADTNAGPIALFGFLVSYTADS